VCVKNTQTKNIAGGFFTQPMGSSALLFVETCAYSTDMNATHLFIISDVFQQLADKQDTVV
jgi:hypothetical protein